LIKQERFQSVTLKALNQRINMNKQTKDFFVGLVQLYAESGVNFGEFLSLQKTSEWAGQLNKHLEREGVFLKKNKDYTLSFTITSSAAISELVIKGPTISRRNKYVAYVIWIPYAPVISDSNPLEKLTEYFKQGVKEVLEKLEYPEESIRNAVEKVK